MLPETPLPTKDGQLITTDELAEDTEVLCRVSKMKTHSKAFETSEVKKLYTS